MSDSIVLEDIRMSTIIGAFPFEHLSPQELVLSVKLHLDLRRAGQSDSLSDTVDYGALEASLVERATTARYLLLEALAEDLAQVCLAHSLVSQVVIRLEKPGAPIRARRVAVEISRNRESTQKENR